MTPDRSAMSLPTSRASKLGSCAKSRCIFGRATILPPQLKEAQMDAQHLYLAMVITGYALFMSTLAGVSLYVLAGERRR